MNADRTDHFACDASTLDGYVSGDYIVTTVRVEHGPRHDRVSVWCRGGLAGTLTVDAGDGETIARRLLNGQVAP